AGGISNGDTLNIKNSIVANSTGGNCKNFATFTAAGVNYDTDGSCPGFTQVTAPQLNLGQLQLNAPGTTATHALLTGSIAIDKALDCTDLSSPPQPVTTDQRGVDRPQGAACDVGAFEVVGPAGLINALIATIQGYNPRLAQGIENSLLVKLNA